MRKWSPAWLVALIIGLGVWCRRAALESGFWSDDYLQYAMLHGQYPLARSGWDLFRFSDGSSEEMHRHLDFGSFPYWSHPHFKLALLRPLASLSHTFDYRWFGTDPLKHHIHSFLWWALSVCAVAFCLRRALSWPIAILAVLFYALDEAHSVPVLWLSNRSVLMAAALGFAALGAHLSYRTSERSSVRALSVMLFAGALACGEYALSMLGYFAALELLTPMSMRRRVRSFAPFFGLGLAFVAGSTLLGYGSANSGIYVSPINEPARFLSKLIVAVPILSADLLLTMPADWWTFGGPPGLIPQFRSLQLIAGILAPALAALLLWLARPGLTTQEATNARWLALGAWLSLVPVCGSFISTRLVLIGSVGAAALVATSIVGIARRLRSLRLPARLVGVALILGLFWLHGVRAPGVSMDMTSLFALVARTSRASALALHLDPKLAARQRVIQISAIEASNASYLPFEQALHRPPMPRGYRILSPVSVAHRLTRISDNALELAFDCPDGLPNLFSSALTRSADSPLVPDMSIQTEGMTVHILEVHSGAPTRAQFVFDVPLEDPSLVFVESTELGVSRVALPKLGETMIIAAARPPNPTALFSATEDAPR